jgi:hypothetical protein
MGNGFHLLNQATNFMSYANVQLQNNTDCTAGGLISFSDGSTSSYNIGPHQTWYGGNRGVNLVTKITSQVVYNGGLVEANAYNSSGTTYSDFEINNDPNGTGFVVNRPA